MKAFLSAVIVALTSCLLSSTGRASTGVFSELKLGTGVSAQVVKVTENYTVVGHAGAMVSGKASAGEVLVYSNTSGKLLRRLRSKSPAAGAQFGRLLAAQGQIAYVTEGQYHVHAVSMTTGKTLWTASSKGEGDQALEGKSVQIGSIAVDGASLYVGLPEAWLIDYPELNLHAYEGMTLVFNAHSGKQLTVYTSTHPEGFALFGSATAASGSYYALGAPGYDDSASATPINNQGMVVVGHHSGLRVRLLSPSPAAGRAFGQSVSMAGFSLYVGTSTGNAVYHYDVRNRGLIETIGAPMGSAGFGRSLSASGHLLLIGDNTGTWLYDRLARTLVRIFEESKLTAGAVTTGMSLCGPTAVGPVSGRVFRCTNVGGGWYAGSSLVAATRAAAPDAGAAKFSSMGEAAITDMGAVSLAARLSGGVNVGNDSGLWSTLSGSLDLVMREGDSVIATPYGAPAKPFFTDGGQGRFFAKTRAGALSLWLDDGNSTYPLISEGAKIGIAGYASAQTVGRLRAAVATGTNSTLVNFSLKTNAEVKSTHDSFIGRPGLVTAVDVREGGLTGAFGLMHGEIAPRVASAGNVLTYSTALVGLPSTANAAVFAKVQGATAVMIAKKGEEAHGLASKFVSPKYTSFVGEALSPAGVLCRAKFASGAKVREGLWFHDNPAGGGPIQSAAVAWVDGPAPGTGFGVLHSRLLKAFITDAGEVIYMAQLKGPGVTSANDVGIWRRAFAGGQVSLVMREGDAVPGTDGAALGTIQRLDVAGDGRWSMLASLTRCPATRNQALFVGHMAGYVVPEILQRKGDVVDRAVPSKLLSMAVGSNNCDAAGMGSKGIAKVVGASHVLYNAVFSHGTEMVRSSVLGN